MVHTSTEQLYCGCDNESGLSFKASIFKAARHLRLVARDETGFGWNKAEICALSDEIRANVEADPTVLNDLAKPVRLKLSEGLNLFPRLRKVT